MYQDINILVIPEQKLGMQNVHLEAFKKNNEKKHKKTCIIRKHYVSLHYILITTHEVSQQNRNNEKLN